MKTAEDLRDDFHNEQGVSWTNSQGEPDIDYVQWLENKILTIKNSQPSPTVTDEEIDRRAEKFADDWEELGYSRENAYDYFKSGAKWLQSRLSQPVTECVSCDEKKELQNICMECIKKLIAETQPVTGYSEEEVLDLVKWLRENASRNNAGKWGYFGNKYCDKTDEEMFELFQSLKSKPTTNTEE